MYQIKINGVLMPTIYYNDFAFGMVYYKKVILESMGYL